MDTVRAADLAALIQGLSADTIGYVSQLRRNVGYRPETAMAKVGTAAFEELIDLGLLRLSQGLVHRSRLPSDLIRTVETFEIKASSYSMGAVQAALRSEISCRSWLVVPSSDVYRRLGARSHALIDRLGIGVATPLLAPLRSWSGKRERPKPAVLNLLVRSVLSPAL